MGFFKDIWNTVFGKKNQEHKFERDGSIAEPAMKVIHKKIEDKTKVESSYVENNLGEPIHQVRNDVQESVSFSSDNLSKPKPKKRKINSVVGKKKLSEIKDYLLTYGSIDVVTCKAKFDVKSLQNFIWQLRKDGLEIKTEKVGLHNELGQKVEVTNYRLISKK